MRERAGLNCTDHGARKLKRYEGEPSRISNAYRNSVVLLIEIVHQRLNLYCQVLEKYVPRDYLERGKAAVGSISLSSHHRASTIYPEQASPQLCAERTDRTGEKLSAPSEAISTRYR